MESSWKLRTAATLFAVALVACGKKPAEEGPQAGAAEAPAAAAAAPPEAAPQAQESDSEKQSREAALRDKRAGLEWALNEQKIKDDPKGQWAVTAKASSTYATRIVPEDVDQPDTDWVALRATGVPDATDRNNERRGWLSEEPDSGLEWLEVGFASPVPATALRLRQLLHGGAIAKVELIDTGGARHTVWEGIDETAYDEERISWFVREFDKTSYAVAGARITLATNLVDGHEGIDAVQLIGE